MDWISGWIQGIIIAVIIGTIIEMILPEGNCKKYIKVVIGIYILFSVISPVITKFTGNEFRVSNIYDINTYIETSGNSSEENIEIDQTNQIKKVYELNLKNDIKQKIEKKGYSVKFISLEITNNEQYILTKINVQINGNNEKNNQIKNINEINISIGNENTEENVNISAKEQNDLKQYLSSTYNVEEKNINIY